VYQPEALPHLRHHRQRVLLPIIVFIGQLYINLASGVEVLDYKPKGYVNCRLRDDQKDSCPYRRRRVLTVASQLAARLVGLYRTIGPQTNQPLPETKLYKAEGMSDRSNYSTSI
jgi:hypothetical protein